MTFYLLYGWAFTALNNTGQKVKMNIKTLKFYTITNNIAFGLGWIFGIWFIIVVSEDIFINYTRHQFIAFWSVASIFMFFTMCYFLYSIKVLKIIKKQSKTLSQEVIPK